MSKIKIELKKAASFLLCWLPSLAHTDTPLGWINSGNTTAYTTTRGELEISVSGLAVNDTLDILSYRDDLIANNRRLEGDSGDLTGGKVEIHYGVTEELSVFYRRQQHDLTVDLGTINSINLIDIDRSLQTTMEAAGFKWTFYRGNLLNPDNRHSAASLEISAFSNESVDFDVVTDEIRLQDLTVAFSDPQTFSVADLEDEGWKARFVYTWPMQSLGIGSIWAGYGESKATSGTTSDLSSQALKELFEQSFDLQKSYQYLGASLNIQISPRLPLAVSYEYIRISDSKFKQFPTEPLDGLPGFLSASNQSVEDENHTLNARLSYWLTPKLNIGVTGKLYSNQFLGLIPHYDNPLSGSFASAPYGFAGLDIIYKF